MQEIETVKEHCRHYDCIYRSYIDGGATPICFYAVLAKESRKCKISECDKYQYGKKIKPHLTEEYIIMWEIELYDIIDFIRQGYRKTDI